MVKSSATPQGILYVIATPIGNRDDITIRALNTLNTVDIILAEDTRHSLPLLTALGIQKQLLSFHAHNEAEKCHSIIDLLQNGKNVALISDAGTPLISDPGFSLVRLAREKNIAVLPIPGPCALIAALSVSGIPCDNFTFMGFLAAKQTARRNQLETFRFSPHTIVLYESTHRILDCIEDIRLIFGDSYEFVLIKELTKAYERFIKGSGNFILTWLQEDSNHLKGEFVIILPSNPPETNFRQEEKLLAILLEELPLKQAVRLAASLTKANKNDLYKLALELKK